MKTNIIIPLFLVCILAAIVSVHSASDLEAEWAKFKKDYNRHYSSEAEERCRKEIFKRHLAEIDHTNELYDLGLGTWTASINEFADETGEEFIERHTGLLKKIKKQH